MNNLNAKWFLVGFFLLALLGFTLYAAINGAWTWAIIYGLGFVLTLHFASKELGMDFLRSFVD